LQSLIFFVDVGDELAIIPNTAAQDTLIASGPFAHNLPLAEDNLILKAVRFYREHYPELPPLEIHLTKNLPVASGIGGGTADAAAVIRGVQNIFHTPLPLGEVDEQGESGEGVLNEFYPHPHRLRSATSPHGRGRLQNMLTPLGAEFPVCYASQPTLVEGIGDKLTPCPTPPQWGILLVNPLKPLPTADVFRALQPEDFTTRQRFAMPQTEADWLTLFQSTQNGMTRAAAALIPEIADILQALESSPHCLGARMSGSGATCFGLYASRELAITAAANIKAAYPNRWVNAGGIWNGH
jgi:4-diphosphocytidyl-2-C-methyl-D-erythritol kinase